MPNQQIHDTSLLMIFTKQHFTTSYFSGADVPKVVTVKEDFKGMGNLLCRFLA